MSTTISNPPSPTTLLPPFSHTRLPFYCEESVHKLLTANVPKSELPAWTVVFVLGTGPNYAPLYHQRAALPGVLMPVFWDYHVFAIRRDPNPCPPPSCSTSSSPGGGGGGKDSGGQACVYDYDSHLQDLHPPHGLPFEDYALQTFYRGEDLRYDEPRRQMLARAPRLFRVVGARQYLEAFASSRADMLAVNEQGEEVYVKPPPSSPPIVNKCKSAPGIVTPL